MGAWDVTRSAQIGFYPAERASLEARSPWIEASAFEAAGGVRDVPLPAGSYGSVIVSVALDGGEDRVEGTLDVLSWVDGEEAFAEHPRLEWCRGEGCGGLVDPGLRE